MKNFVAIFTLIFLCLCTLSSWSEECDRDAFDLALNRCYRSYQSTKSSCETSLLKQGQSSACQQEGLNCEQSCADVHALEQKCEEPMASFAWNFSSHETYCKIDAPQKALLQEEQKHELMQSAVKTEEERAPSSKEEQPYWFGDHTSPL